MKIIVKIGIETDGDFRLENHKEYKMKYDDCGGYDGVFVFEEDTPLYPYEDHSYNKFDAWWRAQRLLEHMLCDIHVIHTHHYVLDYLYHMFDNAIRDLHDRLSSSYHEISGNYDGTYIEYTVTK